MKKLEYFDINMTLSEAESLRAKLLMEHHPDHAINSDQIQKRTLITHEIIQEYELFTTIKNVLETYNPQKIVEKPVFVAIQREQQGFDLGEYLRSFAAKVLQDPSVIVSTLQEANSVLNTVSALMNPKKPKTRKPKE